MSFFTKRENVDLYSSMMQGYDNSFLMKEIKKVLPKSSSLLELGMGTGIDLLSLSEEYEVIGSDYSQLFVDDFHKISEIEAVVLDAVSVNINNKFDCIYSNKVLQHLSKKDFVISLKNQAKRLKNNGILFFTLWNGEYREEFEFDGELRFVYYNRKIIEKLLPDELKIERILTYSEFEDDDSIIIILRLK